MVDNKLLSRAQSGDAEAQFLVGDYFDSEENGESNYVEATKWFNEAAKAGRADAQNRLGNILIYGKKDVQQDVVQAMSWYTKAAQQGHAGAQYNLAKKYYDGDLIPNDYEKAIYWFEKAAAQDDADAYFYLGACHKEGLGCPVDFLKAIELWETAANMGDDSAMFQLGILFCYGNVEAGIEKDLVKAFSFLEKSAMLGHGGSMELLGECYRHGWGIPESIENAVYWYEKSAETGNSYGQFELGSCYFFGQGVEQDYTKARELFENAAEQNHELALYNLGVIYEDGLSVQQNIPKAIEYYEASVKAASSNIGVSIGQYRIGLLYYDGIGVKQDKDKAFELFTLSADAGDSDAQCRLGMLYATELNDPPSVLNIRKAIKYLFMSAEQGNIKAAYLAYQFSMVDDGEEPLADTEEELSQIKKNGLKYLEFAANSGHSPAQFELGKRHINGIDVPLAIDKGLQLTVSSAENDNLDAMTYLALAYRKGEFVNKDIEKAITWLKKILEISPDETKVLVELGMIFQEENKLIEAAEYFTKAGELGSKYASFCAAIIYKILGSAFIFEEPDFSLENFQNAIKWSVKTMNDDTDDSFIIECAKNLSEIQMGLGIVLFFEQDKGDARPYLENASRAGLRFADVLLGEMEARELSAQKRPFHEFSNAFNTIHNAVREGKSAFSPDQLCLAYSFLGDKLIWGVGTKRNDNLAYDYYCIAANQNSRFSSRANKRLENFRRKLLGGYEYIHS